MSTYYASRHALRYYNPNLQTTQTTTRLSALHGSPQTSQRRNTLTLFTYKSVSFSHACHVRYPRPTFCIAFASSTSTSGMNPYHTTEWRHALRLISRLSTGPSVLIPSSPLIDREHPCLTSHSMDGSGRHDTTITLVYPFFFSFSIYPDSCIEVVWIE